VAALKSLVASVALAVAMPAHADPVDRWRPFIAEASARFGIPVAWIERVMRAESRGLTVWQGRPITSRAGAMGLMQLMPATWTEMRARLGLGANPHDPRDNIVAGTFYLRLMYERFGYPGLFGAYNAGPARYGRFLDGSGGLPAETRTYLASVTGRPAGTLTTPATIAQQQRLFVAPGSGALTPQRPANLFVRLASNSVTSGLDVELPEQTLSR
jgi:soluble lytic murein transglycosylase-like protein